LDGDGAGLTRDGDGDGVGNLVGTGDEAGGNDIPEGVGLLEGEM
jgi:hypothetical protein